MARPRESETSTLRGRRGEFRVRPADRGCRAALSAGDGASRIRRFVERMGGGRPVFLELHLGIGVAIDLVGASLATAPRSDGVAFPVRLGQRGVAGGDASEPSPRSGAHLGRWTGGFTTVFRRREVPRASVTACSASASLSHGGLPVR